MNRFSLVFGKSGYGNGSTFSGTSTTSGTEVAESFSSWESLTIDSGVPIIIDSSNVLPMIGVNSSSAPRFSAQLETSVKKTISVRRLGRIGSVISDLIWSQRVFVRGHLIVVT